MNIPTPGLVELFEQLGLPADEPAIDAFVARHRPLPAGQALCDAAFWTSSQAQFLREAIVQDADWSAPVEALAVRLTD